jgi:Putative Flp pilus-assembly TadE/G-like
MRMQQRSRLGSVVVFAAICLTMVLGFVAVAIDGGLLLDNQRRVQGVADAAAFSGAESLFQSYRLQNGTDPFSTAKNKAIKVVTDQGYPTPTVNIPPVSGPFAGLAGYVEVIVTVQQKRYFSKIWGTADKPVSARAVGEGRWSPFKTGVLVLDPTAPGALTDTGGGLLSVLGVPTIVNSTASDAVTTTGGGTIITTELDVGGIPGISGSGTVQAGTILNGQAPTPDPLKYLPPPDPSTMTVQSNSPTHYSNGIHNIQPGVYKGGITVSGQATLNMAPGIYYMDGGGFSFTGQGNLNAVGVLIYSAPNSKNDVVNINGLGTIVLSPPTTGLYTGISLWQERSSTNTMTVAGNGGSQMTGLFYVAGGTLSVTGNGLNNVMGSQYISDLLVLGGNGQVNVDWSAGNVPRIRILRLVE